MGRRYFVADKHTRSTILGDSDFVQSVLSAQDEQLEARYMLQSQGYDFRYTLARVAQLTGLETDQILNPDKQADRLYARSLLCHWAIHDLRMTAVAVSKLLGISLPAVARAAYRGEAIAAANSLELVQRQIHGCLLLGATVSTRTRIKSRAGEIEPPA